LVGRKMALEVTEEQKIIWNALKKRNAYFAKKKTRACCPTMEAFIEKEKRKNERKYKRISKTA